MCTFRQHKYIFEDSTSLASFYGGLVSFYIFSPLCTYKFVLFQNRTTAQISILLQLVIQNRLSFSAPATFYVTSIIAPARTHTTSHHLRISTHQLVLFNFHSSTHTHFSFKPNAFHSQLLNSTIHHSLQIKQLHQTISGLR